MSETLIFGGTFDPVHVGHIRSAKALQQALDGIHLAMIPCQVPPHRPTPAATPDQRLEMLKLAVADETGISVDDCELHRTDRSYTVDTLRSYRERTSGMLGFVMGLDSWLTLPTWRDWQRLCDYAHLIVLMRPGSDAQEPEVLADWSLSRRVDSLGQLRDLQHGHVCHVTLAQIDVSATQVRAAVASEQDVSTLLHPNVASYIATHGLYLNN